MADTNTNLFELFLNDPFRAKSTRKGGCFREAFRLQEEQGGLGTVYYVGKVGENLVRHAYYVEDPTKTDAFAKNQADNGYEGYPRLTVGQVLEYALFRASGGKEL